MIVNVAGFLIFLSVCGIVASNPERGVDCRKFVFAPLCRGVAAKRGPLDTGHSGQNTYTSDDSFRHLLTAIGMLEDEYDETAELTNKNEAERFARLYPLNRPNPVSRFMFENRRSNSEKDNFPGQEYENL